MSEKSNGIKNLEMCLVHLFNSVDISLASVHVALGKGTHGPLIDTLGNMDLSPSSKIHVKS